ncbi:MAG: hypothetical protein QF812_00880 [Nitrososphaerales archaeon]|nr:hypothetical protein [Nitrososphaerales archaeon]
MGPNNNTDNALVACPRPIGSRPVTAGSSVPLCPALSSLSIFLTQATTSWLVGPAGLSSGMNP